MEVARETFESGPENAMIVATEINTTPLDEGKGSEVIKTYLLAHSEGFRQLSKLRQIVCLSIKLRALAHG